MMSFYICRKNKKIYGIKKKFLLLLYIFIKLLLIIIIILYTLYILPQLIKMSL